MAVEQVNVRCPIEVRTDTNIGNTASPHKERATGILTLAINVERQVVRTTTRLNTANEQNTNPASTFEHLSLVCG
ncbi:hypothetical protein [Chamaesiphon polymorphus]|uniref:hypothetical protein n=1 Tax=Chamaesiphon polymorphus TaxID=2107691 RepID=UPI0015E6ED1E|nr:hypothetical protein [Chamaesiphon polymorphus]